MQADAIKRTGKGKFEITEFVNPSGATVYRVKGWTMDGLRYRKNFKTHAEALATKQELEIKAANLANAGTTVFTRLTPVQVNECEAAYSQLGDRSLLAAVKFYLENYREPVTAITVNDAFDKFLADKRAQNCRAASVASLAVKCAGLRREYGARNVGELLEDQVKALIFRDGLSPVSQDNVRRALGCFFNWCVDHGFAKESPLAKVKAVSIERGEPSVMPLPYVRKLLTAAAEYKDGVILPYIAISFFTGIRPTELARLSWEDVKLDQKVILIQSKGAKMRQRRVVTMSKNLIEWLKPYALARQPFVGSNWRRDFDTVKEMAGYCGRHKVDDKGNKLRPWVIDLMRHTAVSYHLAMYQHEGKTAAWAGNSPDVIQRHYKGLVTMKDAKSFWKIGPDTKQAIHLSERPIKSAKTAKKVVTLQSAA